MSEEKLTRSKKTAKKEEPAERNELHKKETDTEVPKKTLWVQMRLIPIYVRVVLVILLLAVVTIIGLRIGYGVIGDGNPADVLKKETWTHIVDIISGKE